MQTTYIKVACGLITTVIAASAQAGTATTSYGSNPYFQILSGGANIALGSSGLGVLNTTQTDVFATLPASTSATQTTTTSLVTKLTSLNIALPTVAVNYDDQSGRILSEDLGGSLTFNVANKNDGAATGGSLTLSNLRLDLTHNQLTGTVNGANGVGVKDNVALWTFQGNYNFSIGDAATANPGFHVPCGLNGDGTYTCQDFMGTFLDLNKLPLGPADMFMTSEANALWSQSLGYNAIGKAALNTVLPPIGELSPGHPFGTLTSAVPEAGTWSLMSLGLIGLFGMSARRRYAA